MRRLIWAENRLQEPEECGMIIEKTKEISDNGKF